MNNSIECYPLKFFPIFKERLWGGRALENYFGKRLPPGKLIGESWEIADRTEGVSIVSNGQLAGKSLRELMEVYRKPLLGQAKDINGRFPLLVKILDARDILSVQVHPSEKVAYRLGGEPKTEIWYIVEAASDAFVILGLRKGVKREGFISCLNNRCLERCLHKIKVKKTDVLFIPPGRVHALGGGIVAYEIQQNSDTTYRVFDWDRVETNGNPRPLHIAEALEAIDFQDWEPSFVDIKAIEITGGLIRKLTSTGNVFDAYELILEQGASYSTNTESRPWILGVVEGSSVVITGATRETLVKGEFILIPAAVESFKIVATSKSIILLSNPTH